MNTDKERLDFIIAQSKHSQTGISLWWTPEDGYRVMTYHKLDEGKDDARSAIDNAMAIR